MPAVPQTVAEAPAVRAALPAQGSGLVRAAGDDAEQFRKERTREFRERFANPYAAAEKGWIDEVIQPRDTRPKLIAALEMLENKADTTPRKKHGNIPL